MIFVLKKIIEIICWERMYKGGVLRISSATCCNFDSVLLIKSKLNPRFPNSTAKALPMPSEAPVTTIYENLILLDELNDLKRLKISKKKKKMVINV